MSLAIAGSLTISNCATDEDENTKRDEHTPQQLKLIGTVTLKLSFINSITKRDRTPEPRESPAEVHREKLPSLGEVAEKSMEGDAKSHQARSVPT